MVIYVGVCCCGWMNNNIIYIDVFYLIVVFNNMVRSFIYEDFSFDGGVESYVLYVIFFSLVY